jgi:hypothetical protein
MKTQKYQRRLYRNQVDSAGLYSLEVVVKETDVRISADKPLDRAYIQGRIALYRDEIEDYISRDARFLSSLKPIPVEMTCRPIIKKMAQAAQRANVGPMAAVAGAIAQYLGRDLQRRGFREVIVENGGDIFLTSRKIRRIGIYAGPSKYWLGLRLAVHPSQTPLGICTSSGTIGHSLSFGCADCAIVFSRNAALADAAATAIGNLVQSRSDLNKAIAFARSIPGVLAAAIIIKNSLASWGKIEFLY